MKAMKYYIGLAALMLVAACTVEPLDSSIPIDETVSQGNVVTLTATLGPKGGADTKALIDPGDGTLTSAWAVNEELLVGYQKTDDSYDYVKVKITSVDGSGNAIITLDLVDPKDGSDIDFNYPYSSAAVEKDYYYDQLGTLADISKNYDLCHGSGILNVDGSLATLAGNVSMTRNVFIWKFTFTDGSSDITSQITSLVIDDGGGCPYTVSPSGQDVIYVAMTSNGIPADISITAFTGTGVYTRTKAGVSLDNGKLYTSNALALTASSEVNLASKTADYTANNGDVLTGTLAPSYKLIIPMDAVVMLKDATIDYGGFDCSAITCLGNATIVIADGTTNSVTVPGGDDPSMSGYPGIWAGDYGHKLTIKGGTGVLNIVGGYLAAGIGYPHFSYTGVGSHECGVIQIDGGVINSYAGYHTVLGDGCESGIGSICSAPSGDLCEGIIINGGTVTAKGGTAGIGSSGGANVEFITINGGTVNATGGGNSPGIGAGEYGFCGDITINGGNVTASCAAGETYSAAIGSGQNGTCGDIIITGGTVNANGKISAAGIGSGQGGSCGSILISGGIIVASGDEPGIGSGAGGSCGNITITGGDINSSSLNGAGTGPGIGAGMGSTCGDISISGGTIVAKGGAAAAGIGSASGGSSSYNSLTIATGITKVTATKGIGGSENKPIGQGDSDTTSPAPVFSGVIKDDVNSTDDTWIYK